MADPNTIIKKEPIVDISADDSQDTNTEQHKIHIRVQQRNGRKSVTTVQGLAGDIDHQKLLKALKKEFGCNGNLDTDPKHGTIIALQGDQRMTVQRFLIENSVCTIEEIESHGF